MEGLQLIETEKRKPSAIFNGYQYRIHRTNKENVISWACINEKTQKCKGRLASKDNVILRVSDHVCKPDVALLEVKKHISNARKRARSDGQPLVKIYREELGEVFNRGYELVTEVPEFLSIKSSLYRARQNVLGMTKEPTNSQDIVLSEDLIQMDDGFNFLMIDDGQDERILAFASRKGREALATSRIFFMDGTFKSCSKQFRQIYTIHADIGSTAEETRVIPAVFALLPNMKQKTYERLFSLVKKSNECWNPQTVVIDFEASVIQALTNLFDTVEISGCNFHFNQCIWRKIQDVGLAKEYIRNDEVRLHLRMCAALAYLPVDQIDDGWLCIQESSPIHPKLIEFYDYFVHQWLENSSLHVRMWNCNGKRHRTNNAVEGWNHKLNALLSKPHPNIIELIRCLKVEASHSDFLYDRMNLNLESKKRKKQTLKLDERIRRTMATFYSTGDIKKCLINLSYIQKLE